MFQQVKFDSTSVQVQWAFQKQKFREREFSTFRTCIPFKKIPGASCDFCQGIGFESQISWVPSVACLSFLWTPGKYDFIFLHQTAESHRDTLRSASHVSFQASSGSTLTSRPTFAVGHKRSQPGTGSGTYREGGVLGCLHYKAFKVQVLSNHKFRHLKRIIAVRRWSYDMCYESVKFWLSVWDYISISVCR